MVVRGERAQTRREAEHLVSALPEVLWVSRTEAGSLSPPQVRRSLGRSCDAAVLDLHDGPDADLLGQCHGFIRGGGALVLRMPPSLPVDGRERLVAAPFTEADVGDRFWRRMSRLLAPLSAPDAPLPVPPPIVSGSAEQAEVAASLEAAFCAEEPSLSVLIADRGRGKSSALGLALRRPIQAGLRVAITAESPASAAEVVRFSGGTWTAPLDVLSGEYDIIVVDEAARLSVPLLQAMVRRHPQARIAFASTVRGYEGTGRGFVLRFLRWLAQQPRPLQQHTLREPIRWTAGDPLEALIFSLLCLDAGPSPSPPVSGEVVARAVDREALVHDERLLREIFGLLVHAHYRTTPGDLHRLLDAPNLSLHTLERAGSVVAVTLVAREGGLSAQVCADILSGRVRVRGHALPDTLICHAGQEASGMLRMVRSVRIATHPALRRQGLASRLVAHVHEQYDPDLFGTMFGATPAILRFRRALGYRLVRVGSARGSRTGEPSAVMLRPGSPAAAALVAALREQLARDLPVQLALNNELPLADGLQAALAEGLTPPTPMPAPEALAAVRRYAFGPCPSDAVALPLRALVAENAQRLAQVDGGALLAGRVLEDRSWRALAVDEGMSVPATQRKMRRATQALLRLLGG